MRVFEPIGQAAPGADPAAARADIQTDIAFARIEEGATTPLGDAPNSFETRFTVSAGDTIDGAIDFDGDIDWFRIDLEAGQVYDFAQTGLGLDLVVYDETGARVAANADGGFQDRFQLYFAPAETGTYFIEVTPDFRNQSLPYTVSVSEAGPDTIADFARVLTTDYWSNIGIDDGAGLSPLPRRFEGNTVFYNLESVWALPTQQQELIYIALEAWETYSDVDFIGILPDQENEEAGISIALEFQNTGTGVFTTFDFVDPEDEDAPQFEEIVELATVNVGQNVIDAYGARVDSMSYMGYLYGIGRAMGLGNAGFYDSDNADPNTLAPDFGSNNYFFNDSWQMSVMSAFPQEENFLIGGDSAVPVSPMAADIRAIQSIYGVPGNVNSADTIYGANSNATDYAGTLSFMLRGGLNPPFFGGDPVAMTLFDSGGVDTIDASFSDADQTISLLPDSSSDIGGLARNVTIYTTTIIENAVGGGGDDALIGNDAGNVLEGGAGDDTIDGGPGADIAVFAVARSDATVTQPSEGTIRVVSSLGTDILTNIETVRFTDGTFLANRLAPVVRIGTDADDVIVGFDGRDQIQGRTGDDTLSGLGADDTLWGGPGADSLYAGDGDDLAGGGAGDDSVWGAAGDDLLYGGTGNDEIGGGAGSDSVWGMAGADLVYGGDGDDMGGGGAGADSIWGIAGADTLSGGSGDDVVGGGADDDSVWGDAGADTLYGGAGDDIAGGGAGDDTVWGGDGADTLYGGDGADRLDGGAGSDVLTGGADADRFVFSGSAVATDRITDFAAAEGDVLALDDALWGGAALTPADIVDSFASAVGADTVLDFGGGLSLVVEGVADPLVLVAAIEIV